MWYRTVAGSIYPAYASYKAIKQNDAQQLEVWLMFWVVMGSVFAVEHSVEWLVSWSVIANPLSAIGCLLESTFQIECTDTANTQVSILFRV